MRRIACRKQENLEKAQRELGKNPIFMTQSSNYVGAICELAFSYAFRLPLPEDWVEGFLGSDKADFRFSDGKSVDIKGRRWQGDNILMMVPQRQFLRQPKDFYVLARLREPYVEFLGYITYGNLEKLRYTGQVRTFREDAGPTVYAKLKQLIDILLLHKRYGSRGCGFS